MTTSNTASQDALEALRAIAKNDTAPFMARIQAATTILSYFPPAPEAPGNKVDDSDQAVLAQLLYVGPANCAHEQYADILWRIHRGEGTEGDRRVLADAGMVHHLRTPLDEPTESWLGIAHGHPTVQAIFVGTPWGADPFKRIRRIGGAERAVLGAGCRRQYIIIPMDVVTALIPEVPY